MAKIAEATENIVAPRAKPEPLLMEWSQKVLAMI